MTSVNTGIVVSPTLQFILVTASMASMQMKSGSVLCPFKPFLTAVCDFESVSDVRKTIGRYILIGSIHILLLTSVLLPHFDFANLYRSAYGSTSFVPKVRDKI